MGHMSKKIIISSSESVVCPSCNHQFSLDQGIARHTIERYEQEYSDALASEKEELEESLAREAERKANKLFMEQISKLKEDLADVRKAEKDARALVVKAESDAKAKAVEALAQEKSALTEELAAKNKQLDTFREQELALRRQKQVLEEKQANFQVEFERKLDEERTRLAALYAGSHIHSRLTDAKITRLIGLLLLASSGSLLVKAWL
jgi:DNA repair exonuclease SbcCD ATPase subunit